MNNKITSSFFGKCYGCKKMREIVSCVSWATQNGSDGKKVIGGYRNFCCKCEKEFGIGVNRDIVLKKLSDLKNKDNLAKYVKCSKCKMWYPKVNNFGTICLVCYGREKHGSN